MRPSLVSQAPAKPDDESTKPPTDRPSSDFGQARPSVNSGSVFGESVLSKKSLDEVILNFISQESDHSDKSDKEPGSSH